MSEKVMLTALNAINKMILTSSVTSSIILFNQLFTQTALNQQKPLGDKARTKRELKIIHRTKYAGAISIISSWKINCGIAIYTEYLTDAMKVIDSNRKIDVFPIGEIAPESTEILHLQHEFGLTERFNYTVEDFALTRAKAKIITFHTVTLDKLEEHREWCEKSDALIVHTDFQKQLLQKITGKPIHVIPHGSVIFNPTQKDAARAKLNLPQDKFIIYIHGFHKNIKDYMDIIEAVSEIDGIHLCILMSPHFSNIASHTRLKEIDALMKHITNFNMEENVTIIREFLTEEEINLYVSASDAILFNYKQPEHTASCSGAMHRVLAGGKPIICTRQDSRLDELVENKHALKYNYGDLNELQNCIIKLIENPELAYKLGSNCRKLAFETSWINVAVKHLDLYDELAGG